MAAVRLALVLLFVCVVATARQLQQDTDPQLQSGNGTQPLQSIGRALQLEQQEQTAAAADPAEVSSGAEPRQEQGAGGADAASSTQQPANAGAAADSGSGAGGAVAESSSSDTTAAGSAGSDGSAISGQDNAAAAGGGAVAGQEGAAAAAAAAAATVVAADEVPQEPYNVAVPQQGPDAYVAICAAVKDQHIDVREWIFYNRAIGINKFYLTDTGSKPPMQAVLQDYIDAGLVDYTFDTKVPPRKGTHGPQVTIYERCLHQHGHRHTYMAFIDVDEFLILRDGTPDMPSLLKDYEQYGGLVVNWVMFGSSGLKERPKTNTLSSYWKCAPEQHPENCHVKSIVRPPHVNDSTTDPHHFKYNKPLYAVNTRHEQVKGPKSKNVTLDRVGLYHYSIKSLEDFQLKMARMGNQKTMAYLDYIDNFTTADCFDAIDMGVQMASFAVY
ncbi:hypothetical protein N2152v2_000597 [Parachlorella kessleri]